MTVHLHITGLVQGVGFRPFVWQLARAMKLTGTVGNGVDGVHVYINADADTARRFRERIRTEAPELARIQSVAMRVTDPRAFTGFSIVERTTSGPANLLLTPDFALCDACRAELTDPRSRRFGYAFTTCTHCGPRYSIQHGIPYDRPATAMASFAMCPDCAGEYNNPADRRFFAQTNSCPACPVELQLNPPPVRPEGSPAGQPLPAVLAALRKGQIVAVKGIGGFLLLTDATNAGAIGQLRQRKHRPTKPLAVLYPNRAVLAADCYVADDEWALLTSPAAPIVLLRQRTHPASGVALAQLAPGLNRLGVVLPYAPLLALIADEFNQPLVATSGNPSGSPICYTNEQALDQLATIADLILTHNRDIVLPQDDSVVQLTPTARQPIVLRRARGYAPTFTPPLTQEGSILALGASLKSTFAWQLRGNTYVSQYLGDLERFETQTQFRRMLARFGALLTTTPALLVADAHEGYFSTQLARRLSAEWNVPLRLVQHHEAHLAAVLAEHESLTAPEPVLGVIWDGTGYGPDGHVWGGEFIRYDPLADVPFKRLTHLAYFDALLGDKMPREPRLSALSLAHNLPEAAPWLRAKFSPNEWALYPKLIARNHLKTSSVGRLFDGVAALLGLADRVSYEGEAAGLLEEQATRFVEQHGYAGTRSYLPAWWPGPVVPTPAIMAGVVADLTANAPVAQIAASFHHTLVEMVAAVARQTGHTRLAFSGGVFQNALLTDWLYHRLAPTHTLLFHRQLAPNDESIALGQLAHFTRTQRLHQTTESDVFSDSR